MTKPEKHDDQMTEWIMCLKAAKEVWDAAFLKDDKYEVNMHANLILDLAKEIHNERAAKRYQMEGSLVSHPGKAVKLSDLRPIVPTRNGSVIT